MKSTAEYIELLRQFKRTRAVFYKIRSLGLFGSVARGEQGCESDVDVVYEGEADLLLRSSMKMELETLLGCKVDVVRYRDQIVDTVFGRSITKDIILV